MKATPINILYQGNLECDVRHTRSTGRVHTDLPKTRGGADSGFSPADLFASAVGSSVITTMATASKERNIELRGAKVQVDYALGEERIDKLAVRVTIPKRLGDEERDALEAEARKSPCYTSLHPDIKAELMFHYLGA